NKSKIVEHWMGWLEGKFISIDEPACWACHTFWWGKYDINIENKSEREILNQWNKISPLEICHIIPRQFGGGDTVDNLFLMCKECHDKAPDTRSKAAFFKWVKAQCHITNIHQKIICELKTYELEDKVEEISRMLEKGAPKAMKNNLGIHFNQRRELEIKPATVMAAIATYLNEQGNE